MLSIFSIKKYHQQIHEIINSEPRLNELVDVYDSLEHFPTPNTDTILITKGEIGFPLDWHNTQLPFLLPEEIELNQSTLLGIIFAKLGNFEKAHAYLHQQNNGLYKDLYFQFRIQNNDQIDPAELVSNYTPYEDYRLMHNNAVLRHYGFAPGQMDVHDTVYFYDEALRSAPSAEHEAFTAKQLALFLIDIKQIEAAEEVLERCMTNDLSTNATTEIRQTLCQAWIQQLSEPGHFDLLVKLKSTLSDVIRAYEKQGRSIEIGLLLLDAAQVAHMSESYTESLGYISKAVDLFEKEGQTELVGNAYFRKGTLLNTWAQNSNPQFIKPAIESYQKAKQIFSKDVAPDVYADIQHQLGVLYMDMPTDPKQKSIWVSLAVTAFEEALSFFTKEEFPYQYGMICNNYGNAIMKFPPAVLSDHYQKALHYYEEALDVRTKNYPVERAITLLNFLESSWDVGNDPDKFNDDRYLDMVAKANEVKTLVTNKEMLEEADRHLDLLDKLKQSVS